MSGILGSCAFRRTGGVWLALMLVVSGCASLQIADTRPLPASKLEPIGAEHISSGGYRLDSLPPPPDAPDLLVLVAFSGGGKRSASFGYGVLKGMRELMVPTPAGPRSLVSQVDAISGVSGGSFPAAYYGLYRDKAFSRFETDFLYSNTSVRVQRYADSHDGRPSRLLPPAGAQHWAEGEAEATPPSI